MIAISRILDNFGKYILCFPKLVRYKSYMFSKGLFIINVFTRKITTCSILLKFKANPKS